MFTFHLLRFPDTHPFGLPSLSHSLYLPATSYHAFLAPPTYLSLATSLVLLCLDLFHLYSLPASRLSCLVLEHALLTALSLGLFYAQTRRDLAAKLSLYQATLKKSVEINNTMMLQLNKTNVTHPNATGEETMHEDQSCWIYFCVSQSFEKFRRDNNMVGGGSHERDVQDEIGKQIYEVQQIAQGQ